MQRIDFGKISAKEELENPLNQLLGLLSSKFKDVEIVELTKEYTEGKSPTRVILAQMIESTKTLHKTRIIFKVGKGGVLRNEVERYLNFKPYIENMGVFVNIIEPEETLDSLPLDDSAGAIAYTYAEEQIAGSESFSLAELCQQYLRDKVEWQRIEEVLNASFIALKSLYRKPDEKFGHLIAEYYLDRWFPHFEARADHYHYRKDTGKHLLTLKKYNPNYFSRENITFPSVLMKDAESNLSQRNDIAISGLTYSGERGSNIQLGAPPLFPLALRIDISKLQEKERQKIAKAKNTYIELWVPPLLARYDFYRERLQTVFPGIDLDASAFRVGSMRVHNPLNQLSLPLDKKYLPQKTELVPAHGDLHPGNVLVIRNSPVFIDYGLSESAAPIGIDMVRLAGGLVKDIIAAQISFEQLQLVLLKAFGKLDSIIFQDELSQKCYNLLAFLWEKLGQFLDSESLWHHLYGYSWIGLKWGHDPGKPADYAYHACFLMACMAFTEIVGTPDEDGPILKTSKDTYTTKLDTPITEQFAHRQLNDWVSELEKPESAKIVKAGLHGKEHRQAMVDFLERLRIKGLTIKSDDIPLLLAAIHLHDIALWVFPDEEKLFEQSGLLSAKFVKQHHKKILECGLKETDLIDLENILNAFPAYPTERASFRVQAAGALLCLLNAVQWGRERVPVEWLSKKTGFDNKDKWRWVRHILIDTPKEGKDLFIRKKKGYLEVSVNLSVRADSIFLGTRLADELSDWARHLLESTSLPDILEQYWKLRFFLESPQIKVKTNIRQHGLAISNLLNSHFNPNTRHRKRLVHKIYLLPGIIDAHPMGSTKTPVFASLVLLTPERIFQDSEDRGQAFLSGGIPKWSDLHGQFDAPRKRTNEFMAFIRKRYHSTDMTIVWIISASGNGKSTVLMRMAYDLVKEGEVDVVWRPPEIDPEAPLDKIELESLTHPSVVLIDNAQLVPNLSRVIDDCSRRKGRPPIQFILGFQGLQWKQNNPQKRFSNRIHHQIHSLDHLSEQEACKIVERLKYAGLVDLSQSDAGLVKRLRLRNKNITDLLSAMLLIVKGHTNFSEIVYDLINSIQDSALLDAYAIVTAVSRLSEKNYITPRFLAFLQDMGEQTFKERILKPLYAELRSLVGERDARKLSSRHPVIAEIAYQYLIQHRGFTVKDLYIPLIKQALTVGQFGDWRSEVALSISIITKLHCRELRRQCYREGLVMDSPVPSLWQSWALMESREGNWNLARILFFKGTRVDDKNALLWQAWALMEAELKNCDKARELFQKGADADDKDAPLWQAWALMEAKLKNCDKARELFQKGVNADYKNAHLWQAWALMEAELKNYDKARELFQKGVNADDKHAPLWQAWALMEAKLKNYDKDSELFQKARDLFQKGTDADDKHAFSRQAWILMEAELGKHNKARELFQKVMESGDKMDAELEDYDKNSDYDKTCEHSQEEQTKAVDQFTDLSNEELLTEIHRQLDLIQRNPKPRIACPKNTICILGTCPYSTH